ncbi:hypothetical protein EH183_34740 [Streptomyces sp. CB01881]|nr:hypothetical protein C2142_34665 [Streptomyces sp. CB01881]TYC69361.1 hypothetical protein EH183_34740 [Streptomyces sp. CB01881]
MATAAVAIVTLITAACGGCSSSTKTTTGASTPPPSASASASASPSASASASASAPGTGSASPSPGATAGATVVAGATVGKFTDILVDSQGKTLYLFEKDTSTTSNCYDACATAWPPVLTTGAPTAAHGADQAKLSTTTRTDGKTQVVYNGHPLYYFEGDKAQGDTNGQESSAFGAQWYVVNVDGNKVEGS